VRKLLFYFFILLAGQFIQCTSADKSVIQYVNPFIGTSGNSQIAPVASVPYGMVQVGPDTDLDGAGYHFDRETIMGFSHIHKSGGGCGDFLDVLFQPTVGDVKFVAGDENNSLSGYRSKFSHSNEKAAPGFYSVKLTDYNVQVGLTATTHAACHEYQFPKTDEAHIIIDLEHANAGACTVHANDNRDTVTSSHIRILDNKSVEGCRISGGWVNNQQVYFYAEFSKPFTSSLLWEKGIISANKEESNSTDIRLCLNYKTDELEKVYVRVGVSAVSSEQARKNLKSEMAEKSFEEIKNQASKKWEAELSKISVEGGTLRQKEILYTSLFHILMYPMRSSDVDGSYRGADGKIHVAENYKHLSGVMGIWDTFRAANPLLTILNPPVANDYIRTFLSHYEQSGLLPIWVLYGNETLTMIGYHAMPVIADSYYKGIRDYDVNRIYEAMKVSANKDTFGLSMRRIMGLKNYKKYHYVPADLELESVAITLESSYDDWCIAQMASQLGKTQDYEYFIDRAASYKYVFDTSTNFMRGRLSDGSWRTPFDPLSSDHRYDDYCEGNAWHWTFFVPHDIEGLSQLMGGHQFLGEKLDSLFHMTDKVSGANASVDIDGLIGQYAHGNEPSHHIPYMYDYIGQPWKTQEKVSELMNKVYDNTPLGICGNEDTGQMSAWYVFSSMGFYPVTHGTGVYAIGTPAFPKMTITTKNMEGKSYQLDIEAQNVSEKNIYVNKVVLNGKQVDLNWLEHYDLFGQNSTLVFEMSDEPNYTRGADQLSLPPSMN